MKKSTKNKWGLARKIKFPIKREVRQRCGFGCIFCGNALIEYHHSTTEYNDAREHNAKEIVLLCSGCHSQVTRGWISNEAVEEALENPKCLQSGFSFEAFDAGQKNIKVIAGTLEAINTRTLIRVFDQPILCIDLPESENAPFRISAIFCDEKGNESLKIEENQFQILTQNWDAEVVGTRITIRRGLGNFALQLYTKARESIIIERLNMLYKGVRIVCEVDKHISVTMPDGICFQSNSAIAHDCEVGLDVKETGIDVGIDCKTLLHFKNFKISSN